MLCQIDNKNMKNSAFTLAEGATHVDTQNNSCQSLVNYRAGAEYNNVKIYAAPLLASEQDRGSKGEGENQPSPQPSPIGEGVGKKILNRVQDDGNNFLKRTYSLINLFSYSPRKRAAFTLAEVLITLGIIGVVAALTMPALIANYQKQVTVAGLKKTYSQLAQAVKLSESENGEIEYWDLTLASDVFVEKYIVPFLKSIGKTSGREINTLINYKYLNGQTITEFSANGTDTSVRKLADGSIIFVDSWTPDDGSYRTIMVDINGYKRPNVLGKDLFSFWINKANGLSPSGSCIGDECLQPTLHMCNKNADKGGYACAKVIVQDGWQITKNYPW